MNFKSTTSTVPSAANYGNSAGVIGQDAPEQVNGGLYDGLQSFRNRLTVVNGALDSMLQRAFGPRPQSAGDPKNPEQPSVKQVGASIEREINLLEHMVCELSNFIG